MGKKLVISGIIALAVAALTLFVLPLKKTSANYGCHTVVKHSPILRIDVQDEDIKSAQPVHLYLIFGKTAAAMLEKYNASFLHSSDNSEESYAMLFPDKTSPTGKDIIDEGTVIMYVIGGKTARELYERWQHNDVRYIPTEKALVYLELPKEINI